MRWIDLYQNKYNDPCYVQDWSSDRFLGFLQCQLEILSKLKKQLEETKKQQQQYFFLLRRCLFVNSYSLVPSDCHLFCFYPSSSPPPTTTTTLEARAKKRGGRRRRVSGRRRHKRSMRRRHERQAKRRVTWQRSFGMRRRVARPMRLSVGPAPSLKNEGRG